MAHRAASETLPQVAVRTTGCQDTSAVLGTLRTIIITKELKIATWVWTIGPNLHGSASLISSSYNSTVLPDAAGHFNECIVHRVSRSSLIATETAQ